MGHTALISQCPNETRQQYEYCNYLIDPNKFRFRKIIRIIALVIKFIKSCQKRASRMPGDNQLLQIEEQELQEASNYFFRLATIEVKKHLNKEKYEKNSTEKDGILFYSGRILPTQKITSTITMSGTM